MTEWKSPAGIAFAASFALSGLLWLALTAWVATRT